MRKEYQHTLAATRAAKAAATVATAAQELLAHDPSAWGFSDHAYWLCREAQQEVFKAARTLDPEWAELDGNIALAYADASEAEAQVQAAADELVSYAEAAGHTIRR